MLPIFLVVICLFGLSSAQTLDDCPAGVPRGENLKLFGGNCFEFLLDVPLDYATALEDCQVHGGTLALVKSQETTDFLIDQLVYVYGAANKIWIGLNDKTAEGTFVYEDGTPLGDYKNWATGAGVGTNQLHDCVSFDPSKNGQWEEDYCSNIIFGFFLHERPYVCQYKTRAGAGTTVSTA